MLLETLIFNLIMKRITNDSVPSKYQRHVCAVIDIKGKDVNIISIGYNSKQKINGETYHAEEEALKKMTEKQMKAKKYSIIILRLTQHSNEIAYSTALSKPCVKCSELISSHKIKTIYYSSTNSVLIEEKVKDFMKEKQHLSKFQKR